MEPTRELPKDEGENDETEACPICYERVDVESGNLVCLEGCGHSFCFDCLESHCESCILVKKIPVPCPCHGESCDIVVKDALVKQVLLGCGSSDDDDNARPRFSKNNTQWLLWKRYQKMVTMARDPTLVPCPCCDELVFPLAGVTSVIPEDGAGSPHRNNILTCEACQHSFCKIHGDLHPPQEKSCSEYHRSKQARQIQKSEQVLRRFTKPCSRCGSFISKESGCDHVICPACGDDMCFRCGTHAYLTGKAIRQCHNCRQGYLDHRYNHVHRTRAAICLPFVLPFYIAYMLVMGAVAVATGFFCCCCGCTAHLDTDPPDKRTTLRAIQVGFYAVTLPVLVTMNDFGYHTDFVDYMGQPDGGTAAGDQKIPEIPVMTVDDEEDEQMSAN